MSNEKKIIMERTYEENRKMLSLADKALAKAKKIEHQRLKNGWRYIQVGERTQILVPCDEEGKPTQEGEKKIASFKASNNKY